MNYDFTTILDRRGRDCIAADWIPVPGAQVDEGVDPIPMWVADMSFPVAPCIREALHQRIDYPFFGYFPLSGDYHRAILDWHRTHKPVPGLEKEHLGYEHGDPAADHTGRAHSAPRPHLRGLHPRAGEHGPGRGPQRSEAG